MPCSPARWGRASDVMSDLNPRLIAGGIAVLVAWRWKNATLTIVAGFAALFALG